MSKRAKSYTINELTFLKSVEDNAQRDERLMAYSKSMGRTFGAVTQRYLQLKRDERKAAQRRNAAESKPVPTYIESTPVETVRLKQDPIMVVPARVGEAIEAYVLEEGTKAPTRGDKAALVALKNKLRPILLSMKPMTSGIVHSLPILKSDRATIRFWLSTDPDFKDMTFSISSIADNPKMVRVYRKA